MDLSAGYECPVCGETNLTPVDPSAGALQEYVEDCQVCCRPLLVRVEFDEEGAATIRARPENE